MIRKRSIPKPVVNIAAVAAITVLLTLGVFLLLPSILIGPSETRQVDVILHLALRSDQPNDMYVADLYRQGVARSVVCLSEQLTCGIFAADLARDHLVQAGVPESDVYAIHLPQTDCPAQVVPFIIRQIQEHGWKSTLIVTSPVASRMISRTFRDSLKSNLIDSYVTYSPEDAKQFTGGWWRHHRPTQQLVKESLESMLDMIYPACR